MLTIECARIQHTKIVAGIQLFPSSLPLQLFCRQGNYISLTWSCNVLDKKLCFSILIVLPQAGFIGAWGEWHSSVHQLESNHSQLARLVAQELYLWQDSGNSRHVQVRVPRYKEDWLLKQKVTGYETQWVRGIVTSASQHSPKLAFSRIGFHDDGFMNAPSDGGTW